MKTDQLKNKIAHTFYEKISDQYDAWDNLDEDERADFLAGADAVIAIMIEKAKEIVSSERLKEPADETDEAYERALDHVNSSLQSLLSQK